MHKSDEIRQLLDQHSGQFVAVTFLKKDGTLRTLNVQPAAGKYKVKGIEASERGQQAAQARRENNPHLLSVWSVDAGGFRAVNMDTVTEIRCNGEVHTYDPK